MSDSPLPAPGEVIDGKYRVDALLGRGGMGVVFAATNELTGKRVAVKWLVSADGVAAQRFLREARIACTFDHPNIVNVFDVGRDRGSPYMVMELLQGESLGTRIARGPIAAAQLIELIMPALRGIDAAHRSGIVHRDLKPDNVFLARTGDRGVVTKVLDFGISKHFRDVQPAITKDDALVGTPHYMAPEQVRGKEADPRSDIYALGVILYEALSGSVPFDGASFTALLVDVATAEPPPLGPRCPHLPPGLVAVVERAMKKDPAARFASVAELALALEPFAPGVRFEVAGASALGPAAPRVDANAPTQDARSSVPTLDAPARTSGSEPTPAPATVSVDGASAADAPRSRALVLAAVVATVVVGAAVAGIVVAGDPDLGNAAGAATQATPTVAEPPPAAGVSPVAAEPALVRDAGAATGVGTTPPAVTSTAPARRGSRDVRSPPPEAPVTPPATPAATGERNDHRRTPTLNPDDF